MTELEKVYDRIVPHLAVVGGQEAIAFYERAFGADVVSLTLDEDQTRVLHCELRVVGARLMLHEEFPHNPHHAVAPSSIGKSTVTINIALDDPHGVDAMTKLAASAGATVTLDATDMPWGDRYARLTDPFGHLWAISAPLSGDKDHRSGGSTGRGPAFRGMIDSAGGRQTAAASRSEASQSGTSTSGAMPVATSDGAPSTPTAPDE